MELWIFLERGRAPPRSLLLRRALVLLWAARVADRLGNLSYGESMRLEGK